MGRTLCIVLIAVLCLGGGLLYRREKAQAQAEQLRRNEIHSQAEPYEREMSRIYSELDAGVYEMAFKPEKAQIAVAISVINEPDFASVDALATAYSIEPAVALEIGSMDEEKLAALAAGAADRGYPVVLFGLFENEVVRNTAVRLCEAARGNCTCVLLATDPGESEKALRAAGVTCFLEEYLVRDYEVAEDGKIIYNFELSVPEYSISDSLGGILGDKLPMLYWFPSRVEELYLEYYASEDDRVNFDFLQSELEYLFRFEDSFEACSLERLTQLVQEDYANKLAAHAEYEAYVERQYVRLDELKQILADIYSGLDG